MWMLEDTESRTRWLNRVETVANSKVVLPLLVVFVIISVRKCERRKTYADERTSEESLGSPLW